MRSALRAHILVHLKFLARSRVLLGIVLLILLGSSIGLIPALFLDTASNRFEILKSVAYDLHGTASFITAGLGLFALASHRRHRNIKMIATKPSPFAAWVASIFVAPAIVGAAAHAAIAVMMFGLSEYWAVPYQTGFLFVAVNYFSYSLIVLALLTALGAALNPIIAILIVVFFNETTFGFLGTTLAGARDGGHRSLATTFWHWVFTTLYYIAPTFSPFDRQVHDVTDSLRTVTTDWAYLSAGCCYMLLVCTFSYAATIVILRRRQLT